MVSASFNCFYMYMYISGSKELRTTISLVQTYMYRLYTCNCDKLNFSYTRRCQSFTDTETHERPLRSQASADRERCMHTPHPLTPPLVAGCLSAWTTHCRTPAISQHRVTAGNWRSPSKLVKWPNWPISKQNLSSGHSKFGLVGKKLYGWPTKLMVLADQILCIPNTVCHKKQQWCKTYLYRSPLSGHYKQVAVLNR